MGDPEFIASWSEVRVLKTLKWEALLNSTSKDTTCCTIKITFSLRLWLVHCHFLLSV